MELRTYIENYIEKSLRRKNKFFKATAISREEVLARIEDFAANPSPQSLVILIRGLTTSGIYVSRSFLRYLISHIEPPKSKEAPLSQNEKYILEKVYRGDQIDTHLGNPKEVFNAIFRDLLIKHNSRDYDPKNYIKPFKSTLVLVSGVLNEIFSTAAFERGAKHLSDHLGIHYINPQVKGTKTVSHNTELLKEQLFDYCNDNPDEKLWILAFSKGGLDSLHFLAENQEFAKKKIVGLSTIASPLLGSEHLNHKLLRLVNSLHENSENQLYKFLEKKYDFLFKEFQKSLSQEHQKDWFSNNYQSLPNLKFYTALAMEASWTESHFWMMLTKAFFQNQKLNDGIVTAENALFPSYFDAHNFGVVKGHHLVGTRSSTYNQEALLEAHVIYLQYLNLLT